MTAVVLQHQPGMPSVMDAINPAPSFSARKTQVSNVPVPGRIDLPVNPLAQKFNSSMGNLGPQQQGSINNLLTPPSNISGDSLSPISSAASTTQQGAANQAIPPFTPNGSWTGPSGSGLTPVLGSGAGTGTTPQSWGSPLNFPPPKNMFSPLGNLVGSSGSPVKSDALPPPPYNMNDLHPLPPFATSNASMNSTMAQHTNGLPATHPGHQHQMGYMTMGQSPLTTAAVSSVPSQPNPLSPGDGYMRNPPTPATSYYGSQSSGTPMQGNNYPFHSTSPPALSPPTRISPLSSGSSYPPPLSGTPNNSQQQPFAPARPYQPYGAPVGMMPGHPMAGMPSYPFNSGAAAAQHMQRFYDQNGHPHGGMLGAPPLAHNDRPFKCDQCPQSFNRNHDLKRHKRIHLAVKPFPCGYCDKSFSRKDALKRHILVKGCGKAMAAKDVKADMDDNASSKSDSEGEDSVTHSGAS